jgi:hypothetical protein
MKTVHSGVWISCALAAGACVVLLLPISWFMPIFLTAIAAAFLFGVIARIDVNDKRPVDSAFEVVTSVLNLPSRPLAKIPEGWALQCFLICAAFVVSLAVSVIVGANV